VKRPCTLLIGQFPEPQQRVIESELDIYTEDDLSRNQSLAPKIEAIITRSNYRVPELLIDSLTGLKVIATSGVGFDGIPVAKARSLGIEVTHTPGLLDAAVCELAIGLLLALLRKIPAADQFVKSGDWQGQLFPLTSSLAGKKVGIVGLGRIGKGIASRLAAFEVDIAYSGSKPQAVSYRYSPTVSELAEASDILIVSCPGGPATDHLINAEVLHRLGPQGFLVNVSRGTVVNEVELINALESGVIRGAALDVFEAEPLRDSKLMNMANVVLSPHAGSATEETRASMLRLVLDNINNVVAGKEPISPVPNTFL
jgi:lactate dehydrogenase-like 2-hydroxyacid dehydrogenase